MRVPLTSLASRVVGLLALPIILPLLLPVITIKRLLRGRVSPKSLEGGGGSLLSGENRARMISNPPEEVKVQDCVEEESVKEPLDDYAHLEKKWEIELARIDREVKELRRGSLKAVEEELLKKRRVLKGLNKEIESREGEMLAPKARKSGGAKESCEGREEGFKESSLKELSTELAKKRASALAKINGEVSLKREIALGLIDEATAAKQLILTGIEESILKADAEEKQLRLKVRVMEEREERAREHLKERSSQLKIVEGREEKKIEAHIKELKEALEVDMREEHGRREREALKELDLKIAEERLKRVALLDRQRVENRILQVQEIEVDREGLKERLEEGMRENIKFKEESLKGEIESRREEASEKIHLEMVKRKAEAVHLLERETLEKHQTLKAIEDEINDRAQERKERRRGLEEAKNRIAKEIAMFRHSMEAKLKEEILIKEEELRAEFARKRRGEEERLKVEIKFRRDEALKGVEKNRIFGN